MWTHGLTVGIRNAYRRDNSGVGERTAIQILIGHAPELLERHTPKYVCGLLRIIIYKSAQVYVHNGVMRRLSCALNTVCSDLHARVRVSLVLSSRQLVTVSLSARNLGTTSRGSSYPALKMNLPFRMYLAPLTQ